MTIFHEWWAWAAAGLVFAILEVLLPSYVFLGFAVGAIVLALLLAVGSAPSLATMSVMMLLVIFAITSLIAWLVLKKVFGARKSQVKIWNRDINDN